MKFSKFGKIITVICIMAMSMAMLAGCGGDKKDAENKDGNFKTGGDLIAVTESTFPPFDTTDEDGNPAGFDMDLLSAIAEDQGFNVEYKSIEFDSLIPSLTSGQADIIAAGMTKDDPARQKKVDFSDAYYDSAITVLVKEDNNSIKGIEDLGKDMTVASQVGTTSADKVNELKEEGKIKEAKLNNGFDVCVLQLLNGDVDAVIVDEPVAKKFVETKDGLKIVGEALTSDSFGFAVQKGNKELVDKINKGLQNVKENGTYDEIYNKWFDNSGK